MTGGFWKTGVNSIYNDRRGPFFPCLNNYYNVNVVSLFTRIFAEEVVFIGFFFAQVDYTVNTEVADQSTSAFRASSSTPDSEGLVMRSIDFGTSTSSSMCIWYTVALYIFYTCIVGNRRSCDLPFAVSRYFEYSQYFKHLKHLKYFQYFK